MSYIHIYNSDGDTFVKIMSKREALELANSDEFIFLEGASTLPEDTNYWEYKDDDIRTPCILIKGEVIVPKVKEKVTKWTIE